MGKVYRPEDLNSGRSQGVPDITTGPVPTPPMRGEVEALRREVESIRGEIEKIKLALRAHGITVD
ncbi:MAG: hypothetical protein JSW01_03685 [Candidatus Bathyarchaeota archaeon]|nr:MAG: hypothetical protein JSW01_03685 [Candidatus Bathyarchaeota archaeon]